MLKSNKLKFRDYIINKQYNKNKLQFNNSYVLWPTVVSDCDHNPTLQQQALLGGCRGVTDPG